MKRKHLLDTDGQTLVQVAILMVVLLAFVALAIDVGNFYQVRRQMQNAADAGALAGAREICFGDPARWETAAIAAAEANGADPAPEGVRASMPNTYTVDVGASRMTRTYLAWIVGLRELRVGADAAAICGSATRACGLWPIAFNHDRWRELWNLGNGCGTDFFVWHGDNVNQSPDCTLYYCDCFPDDGDGKCEKPVNGVRIDGDGIQDILGEEGRAYVDFSNAFSKEYPDTAGCDQSGCGANELGCWIKNDAGASVEVGTCLPQLGGEKLGVKDEVNSRRGDHINIPLYEPESIDTCTAQFCGTGASHTYPVSGFGCITPVEFIQNFELPWLGTGNTPPWKGNVIRVKIDCNRPGDPGCESYCGRASGPPLPYGIKAVSLVR